MFTLATVLLGRAGSFGVVVALGITTLSIACGATLAQPLQLLAVDHVVLVAPVHVQVCAVVSMTMFLFALSEPVAPAAGKVSTALLVAASRIVPPDSDVA